MRVPAGGSTPTGGLSRNGTPVGTLSSRIVASMPWLDGASDILRKIGEPVLGLDKPRELRDFLYGGWIGHPLHPMVVDGPIGFWVTSALLDALGQDEAADWALKAGTVSALGAAATGYAQWQDLQEMETPKRMGALHALLNVSATGLYALAWICRDRGARDQGRALAFTGLGVASLSAWLGGDLAYDLGIGVNRQAFTEPSDEWADVAQEGDLEENVPKRVDAGGIPVMLIKQDGAIYAMEATCPHVGGPLDEGTIEGQTVICPWHRSVFNVRTGDVLHGPATFGCKRYDVRVQSGTVAIKPAPLAL